MMTLNSRLSIGFDWVFRLLPSAFFFIICFLGFIVLGLDMISLTFSKPENFSARFRDDSANLLLCFIGIYSCGSLVVTTIKRQNAYPKAWLILGLCIGILLASYFIYGYLSAVSENVERLHYLLEYFFVYLSLSIVAIKHIIMLTRA